jgi:thymidylate synthase
MILADKYFKETLQKLWLYGEKDVNPRPKYKDGVDAHSYFISPIFETYDLGEGEFPIITLRNTAIKMGIKEIFWIFQKQSNSLEEAHKMGINWWDEWDIGDGTIGNRYGYTVKKYDLMNKLLNGLIEDPFSRRHIINLYQYEDLNSSKGLHPCAYETIFTVRKNHRNKLVLDMTLMQRSSDYLVAKTINSVQYVALQMMIAQHCEYGLGKFNHFIQNVHIYDRHMDALKELLEKEPINVQPKLGLWYEKNFYNYTINDFEIYGTENITKIKSPLELAI